MYRDNQDGVNEDGNLPYGRILQRESNNMHFQDTEQGAFCQIIRLTLNDLAVGSTKRWTLTKLDIASE